MVENSNIVATEKYIYIFRGWLAIIAFMDIGVGVRSFIEKRTFIGEFSYSNIDKFVDLGNPTLPHILGMYSFLKASILIHCAIFIYNKPVVSLGIFSSAVTILMYLVEAVVFHSTTLNFHVILPCVLNGLTIMGFFILPVKLLRTVDDLDDENAELIKRMNLFRLKKNCNYNVQNKRK